MKPQLPQLGQDSILEALCEPPAPVAYKVARRINSKAFGPATPDALQSFRYRIGQETRRDPQQSGPIAIFDNFDDAYQFSHNYGNARVMEVEFEPSPARELWHKNPPRFVRNRYGKGYHAESNGITTRDCVPFGTLFAESVYPLRVIA